MRKLIIVMLGFLVLTGLAVHINNKIPENIGLEGTVFKPLKNTPNGVSTQAVDAAFLIEPLEMAGGLENARNGLFAAFEKYGGYKIVKDNGAYLHVIFVTDGFRFKDDVEIFFDMESNLIHYKSQSRLGYSDMGLNRERYEAIKTYYFEGITKE